MRGDTIAALCSPRGKGAISLLRISGPKALEITKKIASFLPLEPESHRVYFGVLKREGKALDQVLIAYFAEGRSFTGEEVLEISCHGGEIYSEILQSLLDYGARLAERGEFSLRAFAKGKIDLVQAEGLLQLIEGESQIARRQAFSQLQGQLSREILDLEKKWLFLLSHLEADIDFALEGLSTLDENKMKSLLEELRLKIKHLLSSYRPYENLQKGLSFGIFGAVNSGKSSLFNALLGEDKAIVSKEEGTTRDLVEGCFLNPGGLNISLKDSAGFRRSQSDGELKGQKKSKQLFLTCDYRLVLVDASCFEKQNLEEALFKKPLKTLLVLTKKDLSKKSLKDLISVLKQRDVQIPARNQMFFVSSKTGEGLSALKEKILSFGELKAHDFLISNFRHYQGLKVMEESLKQTMNILKKPQAEKDLMALELRQGLSALYEILGRQIDDQILDQIFKQFCIGK